MSGPPSHSTQLEGTAPTRLDSKNVGLSCLYLFLLTFAGNEFEQHAFDQLRQAIKKVDLYVTIA